MALERTAAQVIGGRGLNAFYLRQIFALYFVDGKTQNLFSSFESFFSCEMYNHRETIKSI